MPADFPKEPFGTCSYVVALLSTLVTACGSTGVVPMGRDTYMVANKSATVFASGAQMKAELYREGNRFCASQGKEFMPVSASSVDGAVGRNAANAELQFRCLTAGDPELGRPTMEPTPDVRIEVRQ